MIGEQISRVVDLEQVVTANGRTYLNKNDWMLNKPADLASYVYIEACNWFGLQYAIEVWHDHSRERVVIEVGFDDQKLYNDIHESEATAPDHIRALVTERLLELRQTVSLAEGFR